MAVGLGELSQAESRALRVPRFHYGREPVAVTPDARAVSLSPWASVQVHRIRGLPPGTQHRMTDSPTFSKVDADRILRRAAEIEGLENSKRLSVEELRLIAGEAGFAAGAVERAIGEAHEAAAVEVLRPPVQKWGLVITHLSTIREIPVEISAEQLMRAVRLLQPYREGAAHLKLDEHEITWTDRRGLHFAVSSSGGVTEIRVFVSRFVIRKGRWKGWVKSAADRLEVLVQLVAGQDTGARGRLPKTQASGTDPAR